ncbi:MAG: hypothetical protein DRJ40_08665 [Thermoprotei archaeon]|nr:MAG: hypothetical protein DRJ40_08665 [Thermoprotei archaeon]
MKRAVFLGLSVVCIVLGIITVLPFGHKESHYVPGYYPICSVAPVSTIVMFVIAGILYLIARRIKTS